MAAKRYALRRWQFDGSSSLQNCANSDVDFVWLSLEIFYSLLQQLPSIVVAT